MQSARSFTALGSALLLHLAGCGGVNPGEIPDEEVGQSTSELGLPEPKVFAFTSTVSTSGKFPDGDVRLERITAGDRTWDRDDLQTVHRAKILVDDGVDEARGGHNLASGQGIESVPDTWETEGPATITPTSEDLAGSLGNLNLTSIVVTRENVGTASVEITFRRPTNRFFFWERGSATSPTTANSDVLVEALDLFGHVIGSHKLLRTEYTATSIAITTWNGSFKSPSTPDGAFPQLGSAGILFPLPVWQLRLTSIQEAEGGVRDDGPDYKVVAADPFSALRHIPHR